MAQDRVLDMTKGNPLPLIIIFSIPLIGGQFLQQLYTVTDTAIVGHGIGVEALAAVGGTDWLYWLFLWTAAGFGQGCAIPVSICFGEKNYYEMRKAVNMSLIVSGTFGILMSIAGVLSAGNLLELINTPANLKELAQVYISILYAGICVVMLYNMAACILRALGDSRTPLMALILSSFLNIALDLLFILVFHWGVAGAGIATVTAQLIATVYSIYRIYRIDIVKTERDEWKLNRTMILRLLRCGVPISLEMFFLAIGGIVLQYMINGFGFIYVAGFTATNKLFGVLEAIAMSLGYAMTTYTGQNYGAGEIDRIRRGMRVGLALSVAVSVAIGIIMIAFGKKILLIFISTGSDVGSEVLNVGYRSLVILSLCLIFLHMIHIYRNGIKGFENTVVPMISGLMEGIGRGGAAIILPMCAGVSGLYFVEPVAWIFGASLPCIVYYIILKRMSTSDDGAK